MRGADPRLVPPPLPPPVTGPRGLTGPRLLAAVLLGCAVGLLFGSRPLAAWAAKLPPGQVQDAATWWDATMERAALTRPYDAVHARFREWAGS